MTGKELREELERRVGQLLFFQKLLNKEITASRKVQDVPLQRAQTLQSAFNLLFFHSVVGVLRQSVTVIEERGLRDLDALE